MLNLSSLKEEKGEFGSFFFKDQVGVKLIGKGSKTLSGAKRSTSYSEAYEEATMLKICEKSKVAPKLLSFSVMKHKGLFYPAIEMEFISGVRGNKFKVLKVNKKGEVSKKGQDVTIYLKKKLAKCGVIHGDIHSNNVIVKDNRPVVLDFGPNSCTYVGMPSRYLQAQSEF